MGGKRERKKEPSLSDHPRDIRKEFLSSIDVEHALLANGNIKEVNEYEKMSIGEYYDLLYVKSLYSEKMEQVYKKQKD